MKTDTTKAAGDVADEKLFDNWFDPVETGLRAKVRGFIETMIEKNSIRRCRGRATGADWS